MRDLGHLKNIFDTAVALCIPVFAAVVLRWFLDHFGVDDGVSYVVCLIVQVVGAVAGVVGTLYAWG